MDVRTGLCPEGRKFKGYYFSGRLSFLNRVRDYHFGWCDGVLLGVQVSGDGEFKVFGHGSGGIGLLVWIGIGFLNLFGFELSFSH